MSWTPTRTTFSTSWSCLKSTMGPILHIPRCVNMLNRYIALYIMLSWVFLSHPQFILRHISSHFKPVGVQHGVMTWVNIYVKFYQYIVSLFNLCIVFLVVPQSFWVYSRLTVLLICAHWSLYALAQIVYDLPRSSIPTKDLLLYHDKNVWICTQFLCIGLAQMIGEIDNLWYSGTSVICFGVFFQSKLKPCMANSTKLFYYHVYVVRRTHNASMPCTQGRWSLELQQVWCQFQHSMDWCTRGHTDE
jgi:hypothetical protein